MDRKVAQHISEAVERQREQTIAFLQRLVQHNSERGNEGQIQEFLAGTLRQMGLEAVYANQGPLPGSCFPRPSYRV